MGKRGRNWTKEEVSVLEKMYCGGDKLDLIAALPLRTWSQITDKAHRVGVRRHPEISGTERARRKREYEREYRRRKRLDLEWLDRERAMQLAPHMYNLQ